MLKYLEFLSPGKKSSLCVLLSLQSYALPAQDFNPADYLDEQYRDGETLNLVNTKVTMTQERLDGIDFIKFQAGHSALYIERAGFALHDELQTPVMVDCATKQFDANPVPKIIRHKHHIRLDHELTQKLKIDVTIVNAIIYDACGGGAKKYETMVEPLTIGASWETIEHRQKKVYRIFNQGFGPNIGLDMRF